MSWISYEGIGEVAMSVGLLDTVQAGMPVCFHENGWVCPAEDGEQFCGVAMKRRGDLGTVQVKGFVSVPYTGSLDLGWNKLAANGEGGIRQDEAGLMILVAEVDEDAGAAVICL